MAQKTKQIIIVIAVIVIAFIAYKIFFTGSTSSDTTLVVDQGATQQFVDGQAILVLLNKLHDVNLDDTIFSDKVFLSLQPFERPLDPQVFERNNPFLPIGVENSGAVVARGTSTPVSASTTRRTTR